MDDPTRGPLPQDNLYPKFIGVAVLLVALVLSLILFQRNISQDEEIKPVAVSSTPYTFPNVVETVTPSQTPFYAEELIDPLGFVRVTVPKGWSVTNQEKFQTPTFNRSIVALNPQIGRYVRMIRQKDCVLHLIMIMELCF